MCLCAFTLSFCIVYFCALINQEVCSYTHSESLVEKIEYLLILVFYFVDKSIFSIFIE